MPSRYNLENYLSSIIVLHRRDHKSQQYAIPPHVSNLFCSYFSFKLLKRATFVFLTFIHL